MEIIKPPPQYPDFSMEVTCSCEAVLKVVETDLHYIPTDQRGEGDYYWINCLCCGTQITIGVGKIPNHLHRKLQRKSWSTSSWGGGNDR